MTVVPLSETRQPALQPRRHIVVLEDLAVDADIGFHDFEVGAPQRLLVTVEVGLDLAHWPTADTREASRPVVSRRNSSVMSRPANQVRPASVPRPKRRSSRKARCATAGSSSGLTPAFTAAKPVARYSAPLSSSS